MLRSLRLRLLSDIPRAPDDGGAQPDDLTLDDPVEAAPVDPDDDEEVDDPAGEPTDTPVDAAADATPAAGAAAPARTSRPSETIRELRRRAQEAERAKQESDRRAEEADRRAREYEARSRPQQQIDPAAEAAMLQQMAPEERVEYRMNKALRERDQRDQFERFQMGDRMDRQSFDTVVATSKLAKRFAPEVERRLQEIRSDGGNTQRQAILYFLAGQALFEKEKMTGEDNRRQGQDRIRRQTTRPTNSRGDVGGTRRGGQTIEQRLENVPL